jgi:hypothetical protein
MMTIVQGDTHNFTVTVQDSFGTIFNLNGYTMTFTARNMYSKSVIAITKDATISAPASGVGSFTLTPADTDIAVGNYIYDVQIFDGGSNKYTVVREAELEILFGVTQT